MTGPHMPSCIVILTRERILALLEDARPGADELRRALARIWTGPVAAFR